jgi:deoxycytidylate deaminase
VYGPGFFLIGIFANENERIEYLRKRKAIQREQAEALIQRDQKEAEEYGQRTRDTFQMADVFVTLTGRQYESGLHRFMGLIFGDPFATPTRDEHAMFLAYAASLRSGDLARQVGAAISCSFGDVIALGCNDVPAPGGGLYFEDHPEDARDHKLGIDSNDSRKDQIIDDIIRTFRAKFLPDSNEVDLLREARPLIKGTLLSDITEFGRSVHAEMDALMAAGRTGVSFRDSVLYTTTFPCHTCTRHIIAAGIKRVVYIEPYPKSLAPQLHSDAIKLVGEDPVRQAGQSDVRIPFEPFVGIGPRRFFDLFSLKLSSGYAIERKSDGKKFDWERFRDSKPRVPMAATSYLEREQLISKSLDSIFASQSETKNATTEVTEREERSGILASSGEDSTPSRKLARLEDRRTLDRPATER